MKDSCNLLIELFGSYLIDKENDKLCLEQSDDYFKTLIDTSISQKCFPLFYLILKKYNFNKFNFLINLHWRLNEKNVDKCIEQCMQFSNENSSMTLICKGFVLSQLLYGSPYMRMFNDIDIYVSSNNMLSQCLKMEQLGYSCKQVELFKDRIDLKQEYINIYYSLSGEKKFNRNSDDALVEVKDWGYYFNSAKIAEAESNGVTVNINGYEFNTFNLQDSFILCFENIHSNFFTSWGIKTEHTLRDILDITTFIIKYPDLFTEDFLSVLENEKRLKRLGEVIQLIQTLFSTYPELIKKIPKILLKKLPDIDETFSYEELLDRIFNPQKRIKEWNESEHRSKIKGDKKYFSAVNLSKPCYDYKKGIIELLHPSVMDRVVNSSLHAPICFSSGYDAKNLVFSYCIPKKYPDIQLFLSLLKENTEERYEDEIVLTLFDNGEIKKDKCDIAFETYVTDFDDCFILSVVIERGKVSLFKKDEFYEVYFSFKWFFLDGNMHNEDYIAASTNIEQAAFKISIK